MLTIELKIPSNDEESLDNIIYDKDLYEVINTSWVDVLNPNFWTEVDPEVLGFWLSTK